jgi:hypothetical protein
MKHQRTLFAAGKIPAKKKPPTDPVVAIVATIGDATFRITHYPAVPAPKAAA